MPRKKRIDYPGTLHHIIVRGINREEIFYDDQDKKDILCDEETYLLELIRYLHLNPIRAGIVKTIY